MANFTHILQRMSMVTNAPSTSIRFDGVTPFMVKISFDIYLFEGKIDAYDLEKWLSLSEDYIYVQKKFESEKITFTLLKSLPHVKYWWDGYYKRHAKDEYGILKEKPTLEYFVDVIKEEFYLVRNYDDQYT